MKFCLVFEVMIIHLGFSSAELQMRLKTFNCLFSFENAAGYFGAGKLYLIQSENLYWLSTEV